MKTALRFIAQMMLLLVAGAGVLLAVAPASSQAQNNTYYGAGALQSGTKTGSSDSAFGVNALYKDTMGANNTADGVSALFNNSTGGSNTASGVNALYKNTTGANNTAIGVSALLSNTTGGLNTAAGVNALKANTTGSGNTAYGANAMFNSTTDGNETALGFEALFSDKTGFGGMPNQNVALGYQALFSSTDGFENLASGYQALYFSTSGDDNTAIGWQALLRITTGASNIGIGHGAGSALTTGSANIDIGHPGVANDNKIIRIGDGATQTDTYLTGKIHGNGAGLTGVPVSAVTGAIPGSQIAAGSVGSAQLAPSVTLGGNTTIGNEISLPASLSATSGVLNIGGSPFLSAFGGNTFVGLAGNFSMTGGVNMAIGSLAFYNNTVGSYDTASGVQALYSNKGGSGDTASGFDALSSNTGGSNNTAMGYVALNGNVNGSNNVALGAMAGLNILGSNNIDIGDFNPGTGTNGDLASESNTIRIGGTSTQTATYIAGIYGTKSTDPKAALVYIDTQGHLVTSSTAPLNLPAGSVPVSALSGTIPATQVGTSPSGMVLIPGGSFTMGNVVGTGSDSDIVNAAPLKVTVPAFYMDPNLVSLGEWHSVYYWATSNNYTFDHAGTGDGARNPVYSVSWYDCVKWCNARSEQAGRTAVYYTDAGFTSVYKAGDVDAVYMKMAAGGYRLPTEAEWEKAARGGLSGQRFPWGDTIDETLANYYGATSGYDKGPAGYNTLDANTGGSTTPIGTFPANSYGLFDMAGNISEWCWDWYGTPYSGGSNPTGPSSGSNRVLRGGYWADIASDVRCAYRNYSPPSSFGALFGFRCVLSPGQ